MAEHQLVISLDANLSPAENAQRYFARYHKAKRAADIIPEQEAAIHHQQAYLQQLRFDLDLAETRPEIDAISEAIKAAKFGHLPVLDAAQPNANKKQKQGQSDKSSKSRGGGRPLKLESPDGWPIWVGKNAQQNAHVTFDLANPNDIWLHARDVPGAHVIIPTASGQPPETTLAWAAGVAAYYSRLRHEAQADVSYTTKKYVRAIKGAPPGLVTIRNEETLRVPPIDPKL